MLIDLLESSKAIGLCPMGSIMLLHVMLLPDCFFNVMQRAK